MGYTAVLLLASVHHRSTGGAKGVPTYNRRRCTSLSLRKQERASSHIPSTCGADLEVDEHLHVRWVAVVGHLQDLHVRAVSRFAAVPRLGCIARRRRRRSRRTASAAI